MEPEPRCPVMSGSGWETLLEDPNLGLRNRRFLRTSLDGDRLDVVFLDRSAGRPLVAHVPRSLFRDDPAPSTAQEVSTEIAHAILTAPTNEHLVVDDGVIRWPSTDPQAATPATGGG